MMMASQERIFDAALSLNSAKRKDKLDGLEKLVELLHQDGEVNSMHQNSFKNSKKISWDALFVKVHNAAMSLIDEVNGKSRQLSERNIQVIKRAIYLVVQQSLHGKTVTIDSNLLVSSILSAFDTESRSKSLGSTYFTIFSKYVLLERRNWGKLKKEYWLGMKNICKKLTKSPPPGTNSVFFLESLCEIIKNSSKCCLIYHNFLDLFSFLKETFVKETGSGVRTEIILIRLANILCLQMAVEFRYRVCEFTEDVFDYVMTFHRKNNSDLNVLVNHFLLMMISIHNPSGVCEGARSFYAFDSNRWKKQIKQIYFLCCNSIKETFKNPSLEINPELLELFVDVSHLVFVCGIDKKFDTSDFYMTDGKPGPAKKRRISVDDSSQTYNIKFVLDFNLENIIDNLSMEDNWFWLKFLEILCCKYPDDLKHLYPSIVQILCQLFCDKKKEPILKSIIRCLSFILEVENNLQSSEKNLKIIDEALASIYGELLWRIQFEKCIDSHTLIKILIKHSKLTDTTSLLKLYCSETLKGNLDNFKTLAAICRYSVLPEGILKDNKSKEENVRASLLSWLIRGRAIYPCKELAKLLVTLISRKFDEEKVQTTNDENILNIQHSVINDFCKSIINNYQVVAFKNLKTSEESKVAVCWSGIRVDSNLKILLLRLLKEKWKELFEDLTKNESHFGKQLLILNNCFWFCELICHFLSNMEAINESVMNDVTLMEKFELMMNACTTKTLVLLRINFFDLGPLSKIYGGQFDKKIHKIIREPSHINGNLIEFLFEIVAKRNSESQFESYLDVKSHSEFSQFIGNNKSIFNFNNLTKTEKIFLSSCEILCQIITIPSGFLSNEHMSNLALRIINELSEDLNGKNYKHFHMQIVLRVVDCFGKHDGISIPVLKECLNLIVKVLNEKYEEPELNMTVLQVLKRVLPLVHRTGDRLIRQYYMKIFEEFRNEIVSEKCGIKTVAKFVECLEEFHRLDPEGNWTFFEKDGVIIRAAEDVLTFLNHTYHEIRILSAQLVGSFFVVETGTSHNTIIWQKKLLTNFFSVIIGNDPPIFKGKDSLNEYISDVTISASLLSFSRIICKSQFWRKKMFFKLFHFSFLKNLSQRCVTEILNLICEELEITNKEDHFKYNLEYLLLNWAEHGLDVEDFPFYIVGCQNFDEFVKKHHLEIIMMYSLTGRFEIHDLISTKCSSSFLDNLKDCYPMVLAFVLPYINQKVESVAVKNIMKLKELMEKDLGLDAIKKYIAKHFDGITFCMIRHMHDTCYLEELVNFFGNFEDDANAFNFTGIEIIETIAKLSSSNGKPLLEETILESPSFVEKVSSRLLENVMRTTVYQDKIFAFYKYIFFVEMISKTIGNSKKYKKISSFFIRDVIYSLIEVLRKDSGETLTDMACGCFKKLAKFCVSDLGEFLPSIMTVLIPLVLKSNEKASDVLHHLICDNYSKLEKHLNLLDPFPEHERFSKINEIMNRREKEEMKSLESRIKHFVQVGNCKESGCRIEGLKCLRKSLSEKKDELKAMYEALTTLRGFSEDCEKSLLHRLICMLVELTTDKNVTVKTEAARCLGELGSSDLTTLVLRPENNFLDLKASDTPVNTLLMTSLNFLSDLLTAGNYWVKKASSRALYAVFSVRQGQDIFHRYRKEYKNFEYLTPFNSGALEDLCLLIKRDILMKKLGDQNLWKPEIHEKWITQLVDYLLVCLSDSTGIIESFRALIAVNWEFAEHLLPLLLDLILASNDRDCIQIINDNFRYFFKENFSVNKKAKVTVVNRRSVRCLLNVVDYIRTRRHQEGIYEESCMDVNYLHIAEAALSCSAFFTAIFYAELWFEQKRKGNYSQVDVNSICELFPEEGFTLTQILRECHSKLGNSDGIHGCGYMHVLESSGELQHYEHIENWNLSLLHHDIQLSMGNRDFESGLLNSLERSGMFYVLNDMVKAKDDFSKAEVMLYKCATRLSDWSLLDSTTSRTSDKFSFDTYDKNFYFALKAFHNEDDVSLHNEIQKATKTVLKKLFDCSLESSKNLYLPIAQLQSLKELEEFVSVLRQNPNKSDLWTLFRKWEKQDDIRVGDFRLKESILTNRTLFIKLGIEKVEKSKLVDDLRFMLCQTYCNTISMSRKEKKYETAIRMLNMISSEEKVPREISERLKLEKSRILWERGDKDIGKFVLNHLIKKDEITGNLKGKGLRLYGDWMAETKSENSLEIIRNYYLKSIALSNNASPPSDAYASLAKFADSNYELLNEYLASPLFEIKQNLINTQQDLALELQQELGSSSAKNKEKRIAYQIACKQSLIDENEIKNNKMERDSYLCLALKFYLLSLKESEKYNLFVFRIISLWLSNSSHQKVLEQLKTFLHQVPSYKFLCLVPQLVPRMADVCLISDLVERILLDHPYHTLPLLFALSNSYEDLRYNGNNTSVTTPRVQAAKSFLEKLQKCKKLDCSINEMRNFCNALIELANYYPTEKVAPGCPIKFPDHLKIKRLKNLSTVCVPSINLPYEKDGRYGGIIGVEKFEDSYFLVGGINLPKRIKCIGSDGVSRSLLVKGKDDLRQDAVMQQVFTIMNSLLSQNAETKKRKLIIRTYKVLPLSQRSGVIEWCENTQPLSLYLIGADGKSGAHKKFYPEDMTAFDCRCLIRKVFSQPGATNENKLHAFLDVCKRFHPVFHYFFIENFPAAGVWFERRLAYIHSVATSSMIGYVLGIGDRHVHNILIDNSTAEVIHIDLGIAFEQGKTLPIPETVPFRLTRDLVDGMGLSGIEGDFRISCIKTMQVLRENQDTILTLLQVLLYDPLYTWTITPEKAYSIQGQTEASSSATEKPSPDLEINKMAERALIRLKQKLEGTEAGWVGINVEGQVSYLIQQARDPNNLCRLFHGWQAYL